MLQTRSLEINHLKATRCIRNWCFQKTLVQNKITLPCQKVTYGAFLILPAEHCPTLKARPNLESGGDSKNIIIHEHRIERAKSTIPSMLIVHLQIPFYFRAAWPVDEVFDYFHFF